MMRKTEKQVVISKHKRSHFLATLYMELNNRIVLTTAQSKYHIVVLTVILASIYTVHLAAKEKIKTVNEIISEAKGFAEKGDRLKVSSLLKSELKKKSSNKTQLQIKEALLMLTDTFYSEEALQLYQQAEAVRTENIKAAETKYLEALVKEPLQPKILRALSHSYLVRGECKEGRALNAKLLSLIPFDEVGSLLREYEPLCEKQIVNIEQLEKKKFENANDQMLYKSLLALFALQQSKFLEAKEFLKSAKEINQDYPESYHTEYRISEALESPSVEIWQRYKSMCLNLSAKQALKFRWGYNVCDKDILTREPTDNAGEKSE